MRAYGEGGSDRIHYIKDGDDGGTKNFGLWIVLIFIFLIILFSVFRNEGHGGHGGSYAVAGGGNYNNGFDISQLITATITNSNVNKAVDDISVIGQNLSDLSKESLTYNQNILNTINENQKQADLKEFIKNERLLAEQAGEIRSLKAENKNDSQFYATNTRLGALECNMNNQFLRTDEMIQDLPQAEPRYAFTRTCCTPCCDFDNRRSV
jgi:hypothetical protein